MYALYNSHAKKLCLMNHFFLSPIVIYNVSIFTTAILQSFKLRTFVETSNVIVR